MLEFSNRDVAKYFSKTGVPPGARNMWQALNEESARLGYSLASDLIKDRTAPQKLSQLNRDLDGDLGRMSDTQVAKIRLAISQVKAGYLETAKDTWRDVDAGTDEFISTATVVHMMRGMLESGLDPQTIEDVFKAVSRPRLPTEQVGHNFTDADQVFQHPTSYEAYFSHPGENHGRFDIWRRTRVLSSGFAADKTGVDRVKLMINVSISDTLNYGAAPTTAKNQSTTRYLTPDRKNLSTFLRERLKVVQKKLGGFDLSITQHLNASYKYFGLRPMPLGPNASSADQSRSTSPRRLPRTDPGDSIPRNDAGPSNGASKRTFSTFMGASSSSEPPRTGMALRGRVLVEE